MGELTLPSIMREGITLYAHQIEGVDWLRRRPSWLLADDLGLGKTLTTLCTAAYDFDAGHARRMLIVATTTLKYNWADEIERWTSFTYTMLEGTRPKREKILANFDTQVLLVNYEQVLAHLDELNAMNFDIVVMDECFPAGTLITTSDGDVPIEEIVAHPEHDWMVASIQDDELVWRRVTAAYATPQNSPFVKIIHEGGELVCTANHPIKLADAEETSALHVGVGSHLSVVRRVVRTRTSQSGSILLDQLQREMAHERVALCEFDQGEAAIVGEQSARQELHATSGTHGFIRTDEGEQPHALIGSASKASEHVETNGTPAADTGRKWHRTNTRRGRTLATAFDARLAVERCHRMWERSEGEGVAHALQDRHRPSEEEDCGGDRRWVASITESSSAGSTQDVVAGISRVVGVEVQEPRSVGGYQESVFNLEVDGTHSYFANGVLVGNCHYVKNPTTKRTKAALKLLADRYFLVTGSPLLNRVDELWVALHRIDPTSVPGYWQFRQKFCIFGGFEGRQVIGVKNQRQLKALLDNAMLRRLKTEVLDLPEKQIVPVMVDLHPEQARLYKEAWDEMRITLPDDPNPMELENALTRFLRLKQICATTANIEGYDDHSSKLDRAMEMIAETEEHWVVFTQFRPTLAAMAARVAKAKIPVFELHGDVKPEDRVEVVKRWTSTPRAVIVCMIQVAGVGLNMTAASKEIFLDKTFVPKINEQAQDRCYRIGADLTKPVQIFEIIARKTIEQRVESILRSKVELFNELIETRAWTREFYKALLAESDDE